jgi:CRP-like cAMP-binding protein
MVLLSAQMHAYMRTISFLTTSSVRERVAWVVHELMATGAIQRGSDVWILPDRVPVTTIATMAGATREATSRTLSDFARRGMLSREQGQIKVPSTSPFCPK